LSKWGPDEEGLSRGSWEATAMQHTIFGIHIDQRTENVPALQATLSKYGCNIRTLNGVGLQRMDFPE
jgi:hypothetical protein